MRKSLKFFQVFGSLLQSLGVKEWFRSNQRHKALRIHAVFFSSLTFCFLFFFFFKRNDWEALACILSKRSSHTELVGRLFNIHPIFTVCKATERRSKCSSKIIQIQMIEFPGLLKAKENWRGSIRVRCLSVSYGRRRRFSIKILLAAESFYFHFSFRNDM